MNYDCGSVWRRWDFHVHTPFSILNNGYEFNPYEYEGKNEERLEEEFDKYVVALFTKAVDSEVCAIGITDYFSIDGYKYILNNYINNPNKMVELFPDEKQRRAIEEIYLFPNIELRLSTFVGEKANSVNYHVLFSHDVSITDIEDNFLRCLNFNFHSNDKRPITKSNIEALGKGIRENNGAKGDSDLLIGLKHVTVSDDEILELLQKSVFQGMYLIAIPVDEDLSKIPWNSNDYLTRKNLYQQCHCYMTSNPKTISWALADGEEEERKREFGSIKPCIWGSDAHSYDRMFMQDKERYCWIKADPTFAGLTQILYEPGSRVRIQKDKPDEKDPHQVISSIRFEDESFQPAPIQFSENLTCIIGGKSTGKSILLEQLAHSIDAEYAEKQNEGSSIRRRRFPVKGATVLWKDGTTDGRKIVYIPQTYLNRTIGNPEESTAINEIIEHVLLQDDSVQEAYRTLVSTLGTIKKRINSNITEYISLTKKRDQVLESIKEHGTAEVFTQTISQLERERSTLAGKINVEQKEIDRYAELESIIAKMQSEQASKNDELEMLQRMEEPRLVVPGYFTCIDGRTISHTFEEDFPCSDSALRQGIQTLESTLASAWTQLRNSIIATLSNQLSELTAELLKAQAEYQALKVKVEQSEQLQKLSASIAQERAKLKTAEDYQAEEAELSEKIEAMVHELLDSQSSCLAAYKEYCAAIERFGVRTDTELEFGADAVWK